MGIGKLLTEQLRELSAAGVARDATESVVVTDGDLRCALLVGDIDRYSVALHTLSIGAGAAAPSDARAYLSARAAEVIRRLGFLEEPLAVWELDGREALAQLRSSPPQREDDEIIYWEVTLNAGELPGASMARYRWTPQMAERELVAYPATFNLVARIADALVVALQEQD